MSDKSPKLAVDGITVAYDDAVVLNDFSLEVAAGETVAVVGPSGSGKSTLLRAIAGLEPLTAGRIVLDGRDMASVPPHSRGMGLMFQDHALFPHMSVADNIGYGLDRSGVVGAERESRIEEMLTLVGLLGFGERTVDRLSGGEAQRVALARALAPTPGLLMLDEPLGSLDRVLRHQLIDDLDVLLYQMGQTSLHVTHDQTEAFALADRVAVLADGALVALGTPRQLWQNPRTRFVAHFLGRPNIWTLRPAGNDRMYWVEAGVHLPVPRGHSEDTPVINGHAVVPVDAVSAAGQQREGASGLLSGTINGSRFGSGLYRHRVNVHGEGLVGSSVSLGALAQLVFTDAVERRVGDVVQLRVDLRQAIPVAA